MPDAPLTFETFNDRALADTIAEQLRSHGIDSEIVDDAPPFDVTFANNQFEPTIQLKLAPSDFGRAREALEAYYQSQLSHLDPNYYLFSFDNKELLDIIQHPDQWGSLDYVLARHLLAERGHPVTKGQAAAFQQERLTTLAKPVKTHTIWIVIGYIVAFGGGFLGMILGYVLAYSKKVLPNGERAFIYTATDRWHGRRILVISLICFTYWVWVCLSNGFAPFSWYPAL
jgi:hypothetical protein